ncbi:MAG: pyridoxamine 5'-phosphate oxidase family protein [Lentisphaeraceae bacterium]|nr:pyridoxamine 5'-phosphate oxidase family protein [Lentisphaeraceae bacterium]
MDSSLQAILDQCRNSLRDAAQNPENNWKLFTVANVGLDGLPQSRYVVLRGTDFSDKLEIVFFTDERSNKVPALLKNSKASLCFFDRESGIQIEMKADVKIHNDDEVSKAYWESTSWYSLQCYRMKEKPGEELKAPFILNPDDLSEEQAYKFFTVVKCQVNSWDILKLKKTGNERAHFTFNEEGKVQVASWLAP